ncbi:uncharacterized membrane protein YcaP (DUF421 family) [Melghirimyces profundicolus]|uniref:Uncharacterized membrane protein YcaP (DUF421 family) n=1 Tax=Melghirimyces profundicolus TaxID=1242148 RepID=A0A2T6B812_9BACL|nr:DUF421 domain-containing protein [Melghirimyces profundicolus]PTX52207.1 uncharacterized membrane protein YcaP (DUF421 family) [Melghirimyces profundicolus]
MSVLTLFAKITAIFALTVAVIRSMGKTAIVQLTPYDLVAIVIIGTMAAEPLISTEVGPTVAALLVIMLVYLAFAKFTLHHIGSRLLLGRPTLLVKHGKVIEDNLEQSNVSMVQLLATLRSAGHPDLSKIDYAILEPTGSVSIIPKPEIAPLSAKDIGLELPYEGLPLAVIVDGRIQKQNLRLLHRDESWLKKKLEEKGVTDPRQVIYAFAREKSEEIDVNVRGGNKPSKK